MQHRLTRILLSTLASACVAACAVHVMPSVHAASATAAAPIVERRGETVAGVVLLLTAQSELATLEETHYTHHTVIDHDAGIYDTDCSGFIDDLLEQVAPTALAEVPVEQGYAGPRAYLFERFFAALAQEGTDPGWTRVARLADAQPGDILAWSLEPFTAESDTGHVVVIAGLPQLNAEGTYTVPVIDASTLRHDDDTRPRGTDGVGAGSITVAVDASGAPTAFRFDVHDQFHTAPIAIGRVAD
jgi:hypothetical protein